MRSATILTGLAILSLAAVSAQAQTKDDSQAASPSAASPKPDWAPSNDAGPSAAQADANVYADTSDTRSQDKSGYDAKAEAKKKAQPQSSKRRPGFYQWTEQPGGNDAGNLAPFSPPR